jgi:hypothetical protein
MLVSCVSAFTAKTFGFPVPGHLSSIPGVVYWGISRVFEKDVSRHNCACAIWQSPANIWVEVVNEGKWSCDIVLPRKAIP